MFIGHFGMGLAVKKPAKTISLGTLFLAAQWLDLLWPIFITLGIEHVELNPGNTKLTPLNFIDYPYSHSLVFTLIWGAALGVIYFLIRRNKRNALIIGLLVLSHWILDLLTHRPDLPIFLSGPYVGFGLWNSPINEIILEFGIFIAGVWLYFSSTTAKDKIGIFAPWSLVILLALIHIANIAGPPPPDVKSIGFAGLGMWLFVVWAYWADKHRTAK
jgi:hypothetical protein